MDVSMTAIASRGPRPDLFGHHYLPVPLAVIQKGLLVDSDLRDEGGAALPIATRDVDSYLAWSALIAFIIDHHNAELEVGGLLASHLRSIVSEFPDPEDSPFGDQLRSWATPSGWPVELRDEWLALLDDDAVAALLADLTFSYLLITFVPADKPLRIVKLSYLTGFTFRRMSLFGRLLLEPATISIDAYSIGWSKSHHVRVHAPDGVELTRVDLYRRRIPNTPPLAGGEQRYCYTRISPQRAHVYTSGLIRYPHEIQLALRVPLRGFINAGTLAVLLIAIVLTAGLAMIERVHRVAASQSDAGVALMLVVPSIFAAYVFRAGEHEMLAHMLRSVRYGLAIAAIAIYVAGATLFLGLDVHLLRLCWFVLDFVVIVCLYWFAFIYVSSWLNQRGAAQYVGRTVRTAIVSVD